MHPFFSCCVFPSITELSVAQDATWLCPSCEFSVQPHNHHTQQCDQLGKHGIDARAQEALRPLLWHGGKKSKTLFQPHLLISRRFVHFPGFFWLKSWNHAKSLQKKSPVIQTIYANISQQFFHLKSSIAMLAGHCSFRGSHHIFPLALRRDHHLDGTPGSTSRAAKALGIRRFLQGGEVSR